MGVLAESCFKGKHNPSIKVKLCHKTVSHKTPLINIWLCIHGLVAPLTPILAPYSSMVSQHVVLNSVYVLFFVISWCLLNCRNGMRIFLVWVRGSRKNEVAFSPVATAKNKVAILHRFKDALVLNNCYFFVLACYEPVSSLKLTKRRICSCSILFCVW